MEITFPEPLDIPDCCACDFVRVNDGPSAEDSAMLGSFYASDLPPVLRSSGNVMLVRFLSDGGTIGMGFYLEFRHSA